MGGFFWQPPFPAEAGHWSPAGTGPDASHHARPCRCSNGTSWRAHRRLGRPGPEASCGRDVDSRWVVRSEILLAVIPAAQPGYFGSLAAAGQLWLSRAAGALLAVHREPTASISRAEASAARAQASVTSMLRG